MAVFVVVRQYKIQFDSLSNFIELNIRSSVTKHVVYMCLSERLILIISCG